MQVCGKGVNGQVGESKGKGSSCQRVKDPYEAGEETAERRENTEGPPCVDLCHATHCQHNLRSFPHPLRETSVSVPSLKARPFIYTGESLEPCGF